jgi:hypothetical protein
MKMSYKWQVARQVADHGGEQTTRIAIDRIFAE